MDTLSLDLLKDPYSLSKWSKILDSKEFIINKASNSQKIQNFRAIFDNFLSVYPQSEKFWLKYIKIEFDLGNFSQCQQLYDRGFRYLSYSIYFWVLYLKFRIESSPVTVDNITEYLELFESARLYIGFGYFAYDFYKLYFEFLETYESLSDLNFDKKYEVLLRYTAEIPMHNYSLIFELLLQKIDEKLIKYIDKNRKNIGEIYTVTQYKSFKLYDFEKALKPYFDVKYISVNELKCWDKYLDYVELNYHYEYVVQLYERAIIRTSNYDDIWIKYTGYLIQLKKYHLAANLLKRALSLRNFNRGTLLSKFVDLMIHDGDYITAKSLQGNDLDVLKIVSLEFIFGNEKLLNELFEVSQPWELLIYFNIDDEVKLNLFNKCKNKNDEFYNLYNLWIKYHPQFKKQYDFDQELQEYR